MLSFQVKEAFVPAKACIIWLHGLGADSSDMMGLTAGPPLSSLPFKHIFLDAPFRPVTLNAGMTMRAWYDIYKIEASSREDRDGILNSEKELRELIEAELSQGFTEEQIFLAGFSQGGAMSLFTGLQAGYSFGGIIALSAYLPLSFECKAALPKSTPIFIGYGKFDTLVLPDWSIKSADWLKLNGYTNVSLKSYPMEHSICMEEISDLSLWLATKLRVEV